MYRGITATFKRTYPDLGSYKMLKEWCDSARVRGNLAPRFDLSNPKSLLEGFADAWAKPFGLTGAQYWDLLSVLLIIRADRQLKINPDNYKKIAAILETEFPEYKGHKPNVFYGVMTDLYNNRNLPTTASVLEKSWNTIKKAANVSRETKKAAVAAAVKTKEVVYDDLLKPVVQNVGSTFKLVGFLTNPYVLLAGGGAFVYWKYFKK